MPSKIASSVHALTSQAPLQSLLYKVITILTFFHIMQTYEVQVALVKVLKFTRPVVRLIGLRLMHARKV